MQRIHEIGFLLTSRPGEAREKLLALLRANGANLKALARDLGADYSTAKRWLARLRELGMGIERELAEIREDAPPTRGQPRRPVPRPWPGRRAAA